jgi:hypothetical protein
MSTANEIREVHAQAAQEQRDRKLPLKHLASFMKNRGNLKFIHLVSDAEEKRFNASHGLVEDLAEVAEEGQVDEVKYSPQEKSLTVRCSPKVLGKLKSEHAASLCGPEE